MRTDAKIDKYPVKCFSADTLGYGKWKAEVGDIIVYRETYHTTSGQDSITGDNPHYRIRVGRMIGRIHFAPALEPNEKPIKNYILVLALPDDLTFSMERWIAPEEVIRIINPNDPNRKITEFMAFFLSPELKQYTPDQLRKWSSSGYATPNLAGLAPTKAS